MDLYGKNVGRAVEACNYLDQEYTYYRDTTVYSDFPALNDEMEKIRSTEFNFRDRDEGLLKKDTAGALDAVLRAGSGPGQTGTYGDIAGELEKQVAKKAMELDQERKTKEKNQHKEAEKMEK